MLTHLSRHPLVRSVFYTLLTLLAVPLLLTSYLTSRSSRKYNVCFVGPAPLTTPHTSPHYQSQMSKRDALQELYGMYRTFDRASYYYVKTPFDVIPSCWTGKLWGCGWPSAVSVATTLSPREVRRTKRGWRRSARTSRMQSSGVGATGLQPHRGKDMVLQENEDDGSDAAREGMAAGAEAEGGGGGQLLLAAQISWDRSPSTRGSFSSNQGAPAEDRNRWCLSSTRLETTSGAGSRSSSAALTNPASGWSQGAAASSSAAAAAASSASSSTGTGTGAGAGAGAGAPAKLKICTEDVPSIVADPSQPPYFHELPLGPPPSGTWRGVEVDGRMSSNFLPRFGSNSHDAGNEVAVQCYVQHTHKTLSDAATGAVAAGPMDEIKGLNRPANTDWNPLNLPGTLILLAILIGRYWYLFHRDRGYYDDYEDEDEDDDMTVFTTATARTTATSRSRRTVGTVQTMYTMRPIEPPTVKEVVEECAVLSDRLRPPYPEFIRLLIAPFTHVSMPSLLLSVLGIYWMGATNEVDFGTIPFLSFSLSMAILSGLVGLVLVRLVSGLCGNGNAMSGPIVMGFSPVVLAWMVIASLERPTLHIPVPGLPLTVPTITLLHVIPFNALIPVALVIAKCMEGNAGRMGGTSLLLLGNVAGIIVGFFVFVGIPPDELVVPHVLVPLGLVVHIILLRVLEKNGRRILGYGYVDTTGDDNEDESSAASEVNDGEDDTVGMLANRPASNAERNLLPAMRLLLLTTSVLSISAFDHGLAIGQICVAVLYHMGARGRTAMDVRSSTEDDKDDGGWTSGKGHNSMVRSQAAYTVHVFRSALLALSVMIVADAMSAGSWIVSYVFISAERSVIYTSAVIATLTGLRIFVNLLGLISICALLGPPTNRGAINVTDKCTGNLGPVYGWAKTAGERII